MKRAAGIFVLCLISAWSVLQTQALAATPTTITVGPTPPPATAPDLIITSVVGSSLPDFVELYNQGGKPYNLTDWSVGFSIHDVGTNGCGDINGAVTLPGQWLLSKHYLTLERTDTPEAGNTTVPFSLDPALLAGCTNPKLVTMSVVRGNDSPEQQVTIPDDKWSGINTTVAQHKQRNNSPSSTRNLSGDFNTDYKIVTGAITLNSDPLYMPPPDTAGLQILEILPNARDCSPLDIDPKCNDYIKLFNPTSQPINLAAYRLRIGYKGQSESISNTFTWGTELDPTQDEFVLPPMQYFTLTSRNDGQPISVTDSGNYVWLEDAYGTTIYTPLVAYPDASSTTKVGHAWAYDGASWQWTSAPRPDGPNYFPPTPTTSPSVVTSNVTVSILKPCSAGQYRNPETNRCRSIVTASAALVPCGPGQERNPETNRCRSVSSQASTLVPCQPGWERNPATNRCRKSTAAVEGASTAKIQDIAAPSHDSLMGWYVAALAITAASAYAVYEWRQEIQLASKTLAVKLVTFRQRTRRSK